MSLFGVLQYDLAIVIYTVRHKGSLIENSEDKSTVM